MKPPSYFNVKRRTRRASYIRHSHGWPNGTKTNEPDILQFHNHPIVQFRQMKHLRQKTVKVFPNLIGTAIRKYNF